LVVIALLEVDGTVGEMREMLVVPEEGEVLQIYVLQEIHLTTA